MTLEYKCDLSFFIPTGSHPLLHYCNRVVIHKDMQNDQRLAKYRKSVKLYESLVPAMMDWAEHRKEFSTVLERIGSMAFDPGAPRFFPQWYGKRRNEYVLSRILSTPHLLNVFLEEAGDNLDGSQRALVQQTIGHPAFWAYGNLLFDSDFPLVGIKVEQFARHRHTVYQELENPEERRFVPYRVILAVYNGTFYQSIGFDHAFNTLHPDDLIFFKQVLDRSDEEASGELTSTINNHFLDFLLLDSASYHGDISVGDEYIEMIWETYPMPEDFNIDDLSGKWKTFRKGSVFAKMYEGPDRDILHMPIPGFLSGADNGQLLPKEAWQFPDYRLAALFIDLERREIAVLANSEIAWKSILYLLPDYVVDHESIVDAQHIVSLPVFGVVLQIPHAKLPWDSWRSRIPKRGRDLLQELENVAKTRSLYEEASEAEEFNLRFELAARCKRVGVEMSVILETQKAVEAIVKAEHFQQEGRFGVTTIPGDFELGDLPALTEVENENLVVSLEENGCFTIHPREAYPLFVTLTGGAFVDIVDVETLTSHIEDLFYYFLDEREMLSFMMMNYLFLLFLHTAKRWTPVRSFGIEMLKLLYPYLEEIGEDDTDAFLSRFSDFVYSRLRTRALVEVKERPTADQRFWGTYEVRPTLFFTTFLKKNIDK